LTLAFLFMKSNRLPRGERDLEIDGERIEKVQREMELRGFETRCRTLLSKMLGHLLLGSE